MKPNFLPTTLSLFTSCQEFAAQCADADMPFPGELDAIMGRLEHMLATADVETVRDLLTKIRYLGTYRRDPASIPAAALDTLAAGGERILAPTGAALAA